MSEQAIEFISSSDMTDWEENGWLTLSLSDGEAQLCFETVTDDKVWRETFVCSQAALLKGSAAGEWKGGLSPGPDELICAEEDGSVSLGFCDADYRVDAVKWQALLAQAS